MKGKEKWMRFMACASGSLPESKRLFKKSLVEAAKEEMALSDWKPFTKCPELESNAGRKEVEEFARTMNED